MAAEIEFMELVCPFCGREVKLPGELDVFQTCQCGATYVTTLHSDQPETVTELHEYILGEGFLTVPPDAEVAELLEVVRGVVDVSLDYEGQPEEEGVPVMLIFARKAQNL